MRMLIGLVGRIVFRLGFILIIGNALRDSYLEGNMGMLVVKLFFFPITYLVYPWYTDFWWILPLSLLGYWISTFLGRLPPID